MTTLICGCKRCGCLCCEHSTDGTEQPCARHSGLIVARWIAGEIMTLTALALLIGSITVWSAIIHHNPKNIYNYRLTQHR